MSSASVAARLIIYGALVLPLLIFTLALVPALTVLPFLSADRGQRIADLVTLLRQWHVDLLDRLRLPRSRGAGG
ncbi:hypothetical protein Amsp01_073390 [Amycolatopsis sp. NBRC 101858]|uniref:hypothetical protein n=1 Tax=Amycolatopsis sp. NBRC 101858 TaxID=3032200 RepID=UPI0024A16FFD|nr:hypothetical protein [Amycolatopsis sp. NBRC 101858]GLY41316.1 hypothetical protein Amsp01_073390 [Amycolatopsis sp. NBRC 101858]